MKTHHKYLSVAVISTLVGVGAGSYLGDQVIPSANASVRAMQEAQRKQREALKAEGAGAGGAAALAGVANTALADVTSAVTKLVDVVATKDSGDNYAALVIAGGGLNATGSNLKDVLKAIRVRVAALPVVNATMLGHLTTLQTNVEAIRAIKGIVPRAPALVPAALPMSHAELNTALQTFAADVGTFTGNIITQATRDAVATLITHVSAADALNGTAATAAPGAYPITSADLKTAVDNADGRVVALTALIPDYRAGKPIEAAIQTIAGKIDTATAGGNAVIVAPGAAFNAAVAYKAGAVGGTAAPNNAATLATALAALAAAFH